MITILTGMRNVRMSSPAKRRSLRLARRRTRFQNQRRAENKFVAQFDHVVSPDAMVPPNLRDVTPKKMLENHQ